MSLDTFTVYGVPSVTEEPSIAVQMAVADWQPNASEYIEYETEVLSHGVLERTGVVMSAGQILVVYAQVLRTLVLLLWALKRQQRSKLTKMNK